MTNYVLGFIFTTDNRVVLIHKNRGPVQVAGHWNGVGGKVKDSDDNAESAMSREAQEEAGIGVPPEKWVRAGTMGGADPLWECEVFYTFTKEDAVQMEDEEVRFFPLHALPDPLVRNVAALIALCRHASTDSSFMEFRLDYT